MASLLASESCVSVFAASGKKKSLPFYSTADMDACVKNPKCWKIADRGFKEILHAHMVEVESAPEGRFFKDARTLALRYMDEQRHFLAVECLEGSRRVACNDKRDILEARVVLVSFFQSLPLKKDDRKLFDDETWVLTPRGQAYYKRLIKLVPDFWDRMAKLLLRVLSPPEQAIIQK